MNEGKITLDSFRTRRTNMVSDSTIERLFMKIKTGDYLSRLLSTYYLSNRIKEYSEVRKAEEVLENAIEACLKIDKEKRLIRISSDMSYDMLIVTMDNSYDGNFLSVDGRFCSTKREGFGIGLSSVQSVARKYYGDAKFEDKDGYFQSSVYLRIGSV